MALSAWGKPNAANGIGELIRNDGAQRHGSDSDALAVTGALIAATAITAVYGPTRVFSSPSDVAIKSSSPPTRPTTVVSLQAAVQGAGYRDERLIAGGMPVVCRLSFLNWSSTWPPQNMCWLPTSIRPTTPFAGSPIQQGRSAGRGWRARYQAQSARTDDLNGCGTITLSSSTMK